VKKSGWDGAEGLVIGDRYRGESMEQEYVKKTMRFPLSSEFAPPPHLCSANTDIMAFSPPFFTSFYSLCLAVTY
jgi:hypothetical protein